MDASNIPQFNHNSSTESPNKSILVNGITTRTEIDIRGDSANKNDTTEKSRTGHNNNNKSSYQNQQKILDDWLNNCVGVGTSGSQHHSTNDVAESNFNIANNNNNNNNNNNHNNINNSSNKSNFMPYLMKPNINNNHNHSNNSISNVNVPVADPSNYPKFYGGYQFPQSLPFQSHFQNLMHQQNMQSSDFTSLPPEINLTTLNAMKHNNTQDLLDGLDNTKRYSDPCLAASSDNESKSGNNSQILVNQSKEKVDSKILVKLLEQINLLHETNSKICRNLHEQKVDLEALKHAPSWGLRHRRDSISGLSTHSQPLGYGAFGTQSPAPTFHSGMYTPGMLTDIVREVKEAARIREEALLSRVRSLVEERSWTINETNLKLIRDIEEMKIQFNQMKMERTESNSRISKLEDEIKSLRALVSHALNYNRPTNTTTILPTSTLGGAYADNREFLRPKSIIDSRKKRHSLNLNYGTINSHADDDSNYGNEEDIIRPMNQQFNEIKFKYGQNNIEQLYSTPENEQNDGHHLVQMEHETLELRRELQDALASRKNAESKIYALENMVKKLQLKIVQSPVEHKSGDIGQAGGSSSTSTSKPINNEILLIKNRNSTLDNNQLNTVNNNRSTSLSSSSSTATTVGTTTTNTNIRPQHASQIQTISPKLLTNNTICLTGPVTDL